MGGGEGGGGRRCRAWRHLPLQQKGPGGAFEGGKELHGGATADVRAQRGTAARRCCLGEGAGQEGLCPQILGRVE